MDATTVRRTPPAPRYRLVTPVGASVAPQLTEEQRAVVENRHRRLRVLAGPGTGKTTTLVETVAARLRSGVVRPDELLVLTFSRRARDELSERITGRVGVTTRSPLVRTLHSYAYSLVRAQAMAGGEPAPRLLGADEADLMIRELLAGHADRGGGPWPDYLRPALASPAFAAELGDLLARTAAAGIDPTRMMALGRRFKAPEWMAAGAFAREYQQVVDLRQGSSGFGTALDQAELTAAAVAALADDRVAALEQRRIRRLYVDEYQDVDPAQAVMIERLAAGADELIVVGDPDQAIYAFRGAEPAALQRVEADATVALTLSRRLAPELITATRRVARLLPGPSTHRDLDHAGDPAPPGSVEVSLFGSGAAQAGAVAAELRRAHLLDGLAWRDMAILVRSPVASTAALARACSAAGVPLRRDRLDAAPGAEPVVEALVTVLTCATDPSVLTPEVALRLLSSPLAGLDTLELRRLRRSLRTGGFGQGTSLDLVVALLAGGSGADLVPPDLRVAVDRVRALLELARDRVQEPSAHAVLWELWQHCALEGELIAAVERGGRAADRAHRTLDAVLELFRVAADLAERLPLAGLSAFVAAVTDRRIADEGTSEPGARDAVALLSAHAAKGLEWELVVVADAQEGSWPDLRHRGRLLRADDLVDAAAGVPPPPSRVSALLAEERRLFYVAVTRARSRLVCTAVSDQDTVPSRFLGELTGTEVELDLGAFDTATPRPLQLSSLVAELRRACTDPGPDRAQAAARQLARLAAAGVPGADPADWHGLAELSTDAAPLAIGATIRVSPSTVESLVGCALRAALEGSGGRRVEPTANQVEGVVVHALAAGLAAGLDRDDLVTEIEHLVDRLAVSPWQRGRARRVLTHMVDTAVAWKANTHPPRTLIGSELGVDVTFVGTDDQHPVQLTGRMDWLSRQPDGSVLVTDFKTAAGVPTRAAVQSNAQLASYQVALARSGERPGGAELVFLRPESPKTIPQSALSAQDQHEWAEVLVSVAQQLAWPTVTATENPRCERCPVRGCCPVQPDGRQVTR